MHLAEKGNYRPPPRNWMMQTSHSWAKTTTFSWLSNRTVSTCNMFYHLDVGLPAKLKHSNWACTCPFLLKSVVSGNLPLSTDDVCGGLVLSLNIKITCYFSVNVTKVCFIHFLFKPIFSRLLYLLHLVQDIFSVVNTARHGVHTLAYPSATVKNTPVNIYKHFPVICCGINVQVHKMYKYWQNTVNIC